MANPDPVPQVSRSPVPGRARPSRRRSAGLPWRSRNDRVFAGVAGGLAEWSGLPPVVVRVAFVVLTAASGVGLVAYVAAAVLLPVADRSSPPSQRHLGALPKGGLERGIAIGLIVLGVALLLSKIRLWF